MNYNVRQRKGLFPSLINVQQGEVPVDNKTDSGNANVVSERELKEAAWAPNGMWAALVLIRVIDDSGKVIGYVLVIEHKRKNSKYKMPGGHRQNSETPRQTAIRELQGETNIILSEEELRYVGAWEDWRKDHSKFLYVAHITTDKLAGMGSHHPGNEGEEPKLFTVKEFYEAVRADKVLNHHYQRLVQFALILPFGRDAAVA